MKEKLIKWSTDSFASRCCYTNTFWGTQCLKSNSWISQYLFFYTDICAKLSCSRGEEQRFAHGTRERCSHRRRSHHSACSAHMNWSQWHPAAICEITFSSVFYDYFHISKNALKHTSSILRKGHSRANRELQTPVTSDFSVSGSSVICEYFWVVLDIFTYLLNETCCHGVRYRRPTFQIPL